MSAPTLPSNVGNPIRAMKRHHHSPARTETRKRRRLVNKASAQVTVSISTAQEPVLVVGDSEHGASTKPAQQKPSVSGACTSSCVESSQSGVGVLYCLPTEILHILFSFLDHHSLGTLALSSNEVCVAVRNYVYTVAGLKRLLPRAPVKFGDAINPEDFRILGKLLRDITLLQSLRVRLKTVSFFYSKLEPVQAAVSDFVGTSVSFSCMGEMFSTFVAGWDEYDKTRVYGVVQSAGKLEQRVSKVLLSGPASLPWHEKDIRQLLRLVFLAPARTDAEYGFWLTQILKPWPIVFQARLLYIITGPEEQNGFISWTIGCGCSALQHTRGTVDFSDLGRALTILHQYRPNNWSEDDLISIIDELITTPNGWCLENVAQLMVHCCSDIIKWVFGNHAINGKVEELSILGYYLAQACVSADQKRKSVVNSSSAGEARAKGASVNLLLDVLRYTLELLPSIRDRERLLSLLVGTWRDYLAALYDDTDPLETEYNEVRDEFHNTLEGLTNLSTVLLRMILEKS